MTNIQGGGLLNIQVGMDCRTLWRTWEKGTNRCLGGPKCCVDWERTIVTKCSHHFKLPVSLYSKGEWCVVLSRSIQVHKVVFLIVEDTLKIFVRPHANTHKIRRMLHPKFLSTLSTNVPNICGQKERVARDMTIWLSQFPNVLGVLLHYLCMR